MHAVLIVNLSKWYGGAELRVLDLARELKGRVRFGVAVLQNSPLHSLLKSESLPVYGLPHGRGNPMTCLALARLIRRGAFSVIDMHNPQSYFWGIWAAILTSTPHRITTVHNSRDETVSRLKSYLYEKTQQLNARLDCRFIAVSQSVYDHLLKLGIEQSAISLISNGIRVEKKCDQVARRGGLRDHYGWGEDVFLITAVGRLEPVKGHTFLLEAMEKLRRKHPAIRCLVVGEGRSRQRLMEQRRRLGLEDTVRFTGFRQDIAAILKESDAFCLPSLSEGLPYALLEACSHRLPIIASKVGGMAEFLVHSNTAMLVEPGNAPAIAEALEFVMANPAEAEAMAQAASVAVRKRFSLNTMIESTLEIYHDCATE